MSLNSHQQRTKGPPQYRQIHRKQQNLQLKNIGGKTETARPTLSRLVTLSQETMRAYSAGHLPTKAQILGSNQQQHSGAASKPTFSRFQQLLTTGIYSRNMYVHHYVQMWHLKNCCFFTIIILIINSD